MRLLDTYQHACADAARIAREREALSWFVEENWDVMTTGDYTAAVSPDGGTTLQFTETGFMAVVCGVWSCEGEDPSAAIEAAMAAARDDVRSMVALVGLRVAEKKR